MNIVRAPRTAHFAIIPNAVIQERRLSYKARGILSYLLSMPDDWATSADRLARTSDNDGRAAILTGMKELETLGYLVRKRSQDAAGLWSTTLYVYDRPGDKSPGSVDNAGDKVLITDNRKSTPGADEMPQVAPKADYPTVGSPDDGSPDAGSPTAGKPAAITKTTDQDTHKDLGGVDEVSYDADARANDPRPSGPWSDLGGAGALPRPDRCRVHQGETGRGPDCWDCRAARLTHEDRTARQVREALDRARAERRAEQAAEVEARRLGIDGCRYCDDSGYRGLVVCDHAPPRFGSSEGYRRASQILADRRAERVGA